MDEWAKDRREKWYQCLLRARDMMSVNGIRVVK